MGEKEDDLYPFKAEFFAKALLGLVLNIFQ